MRPIRDECILGIALTAARESCADNELDQTFKADHLIQNEQWVQGYIAFRLNDALRVEYGRPTGVFVTLETPVGWLDDYSARRPGRPTKDLTSRTRFDLVAWNERDPIGLIEIKHQKSMTTDAHYYDMNRLRRGLQRWPSLDWAMYIFSAHKSKNARMTAAQQVSSGLDNEIMPWLSQKAARSQPVDSELTLDWGGVLFRREHILD